MSSRYYNPEWGRFINADSLGGNVGELLSHNVFIYCVNNPINMSDSIGFSPVFDSEKQQADYDDYIFESRMISTSSQSIVSSIINSIKKTSEQIVNTNKVIAFGAIIAIGSMELENTMSKIKLPKVVRSAKGVEGDFSVDGYGYRIDTNKVAPGEGGFHIHIFRDGDEIAKVNGRGGFVQNHKGETLLKPSQLNKTVRNELNKLINYIQKNL